MCGIIGAFHTGSNKMPVNETVLNQFEDQKERGIEGFGIIKINDKMEYKVDRATEGYKFMWDIHQDEVRNMILHHRIPTSSDNTLAQTHPILVDNGSLQFKYLLVHNGVIRNDKELKKEHEDLGFVYTTQDELRFNDSECVAIEMARFIEGQTDVVGTRGNVAFICVQIDKKTDKITKLYFGRNEGNPLNMAKTRGKLLLSSTGPGETVTPFKLYECKLDADMKLSKRQMCFAPELPVVNYIPAAKGTQSKTGYEKDAYWNGYYSNRYAQAPAQIIPEDADDADYYDSPDAQVVEASYEAIQTEIDTFVDMILNKEVAKEMTKEDVEYTLKAIQYELETMMERAKEQSYQTTLADDVPPIKEIGFDAD